MMPRGSAIAAALSAVSLVTAVAVELPTSRLDTVFPPGAKAGATAEVTVAGIDLGDDHTLRFSHPGITATKVEKRFVVKVAPEVLPGIYDARVTGPIGTTNPRAFVIGELPEIAKTKPNHQPDTALEIPIDTVISGSVIAANADFFRFTAKQGQRLLIECAAADIDSRLRPVVFVLDAAGRELAASRLGDLLDFTPPADGSFLIKLHDLTFAGGREHFYRLSISTRAHLDYVFPPCIAPGTKSKVTLFGRNLPGGQTANVAGNDDRPLQKLDVEIDAPANGDPRAECLSSPVAAGVDGFSYRLKTPQGLSNPVFIGLATAPVLSEQEPNNPPASVQKVSVPCEIAGQFFPAGDVDCFGFDGKKGDVWRIEVFSHRLDRPTKPFLLVERVGAAPEEFYGTDADAGSPRFSTLHNDPGTRLEVKEDGIYRVQVRDLFGASRRDPRNVYRLSIRKEAPDFRLAAIFEPPPDKKDIRAAAPQAALLRAGGTTAIRVVALRRDNFAGAIELCAEGLPAGVRCVPMKILAGRSDGYLLLTADEKVARWVGAIRVTGKARVNDADVVREARGGVVIWNAPDFAAEAVPARLTQEFILTVGSSEPAPVSVDAAEDKVWEAASGAKLQIPLKITRRADFKEALKLSVGGAPAIEKAKEIVIDAKDATATATIDLAAVKVPPGEHTIYLQALTTGKFRGKDVTTTVFSSPLRISVK